MKPVSFATIWFALISFAFFGRSPLQAQAADKALGRPKIGLVLSGGGALGATHVGVLRAFEELRIPVDCIAGTSMGAVIGGLYASGMAPSEIDQWLRYADWHLLLSDSLPRESESFRAKQRQYDVNQGIAFNVSSNADIKLPAGLIAGRNIVAALRQLTVPVRDIHDFSRLPIPYRATATDIETGRNVVLREGDIVEAIRASMSVPAIFTPQKINGRMLVDGGVSNNLPINVGQQMGADVIIAVNASAPLKKASELDTAPSIANQVIFIFIQEQMDRQIARLGPKDAYLPIEVEGLGPTDFVKASQVIDVGYREAMKQREMLSRFSVSQKEFNAFLRRQRRDQGDPVQITFLKVQTPDGESEHTLPKPLAFDIRHQKPVVELQNTVNDLGEMQAYDVGDYQVIDRDGTYGLLVKGRKKNTGSNPLSFGFNFAYSSTDDSEFTLLLSYRMTELNALGGEWATYLSLGDKTRLSSEWYQPIDSDRRIFVAPYVYFGSDYVDGRDEDQDPLRFRQQDHIAGIDFGARLWQAGEVRVGYARGFTRISRRLGVPDELPSSVDRGFVHADLTIDTLDAANFASHGGYGRLSLVASREELGASDDYTRLEGQVFQAISFGENTFVPRLSGSFKVGGDAIPLYDQEPLGGFLNLSGLSRGTLFGENAALAELVFYRKLLDLTPGVGRGLYAGLSLEAGEVWGGERDFELNDVVFGGSIFIGADTLIGPLYFGIGMADTGDAGVYLQLGPLLRQGRHQR